METTFLAPQTLDSRTMNIATQFTKSALLVAFVIASSPEILAADTPRQPNVVVLVADDLGYADVGFHGGKEIPTPHLDALAAAGARFSSGYVSCPVCSPTRAGLVTGRYQQRFGHEFNPGPFPESDRKHIGLPLEESTVADALRAAGYRTGLVGKWHLGFDEQFHPNRRGFDEFYGFLGGARRYLPANSEDDVLPILRNSEPVDEQEYLTDAFGREAVDFIRRHADHPFYLQLTFNAVHTPLQAPAKYQDRFAHIADQRHRSYAAMLSALDDNVGRVLDALHELQLDEQTLVFFVSDNGGPPQGNTSNNAPLRGAKGSVWEGGVRVPFLLRWTGRVPAGTVYEQPVISLDISATAVAVAGSSHWNDRQIDGVNLVPYVTGQASGAPHQQLYWRFGDQWAIRQGNLKLLQTAGSQPQLFDLSSDIGEQTDLADSQSEKAATLRQAYLAWNAELVKPRWNRQGRGPAAAQRRAASK